jgi:hypothetical protein
MAGQPSRMATCGHFAAMKAMKAQGKTKAD